MSCGRCVTRDRLTAFPDAHAWEPINYAGRWRWDRYRRFSASRPPVRPAADPWASRPIHSAVFIGAPLSLAVWTNDDSDRETEPVTIKPRGAAKAAINVSWFKHSGPGVVVFTPPSTPLPELQGTTTTSVVFKQPGEYVIRVRADNFGRLDTSPGNQCCWTNGYVNVTVTPSATP